MASAELRIINRRIKSVKSTKKITRAMELIASSRIVKANKDLPLPTITQTYSHRLLKNLQVVVKCQLRLRLKEQKR